LPQIKEKWDKAGRVNSTHFEEAAWDQVLQVMGTASNQNKHWITKRAAGECGANAVKFKIKQ
jgi:hypothetical protein